MDITTLRKLISKLPTYKKKEVEDRLKRIITLKEAKNNKKEVDNLKSSIYKELKPLVSEISKKLSNLKKDLSKQDSKLANDWSDSLGKVITDYQQKLTSLEEIINKEHLELEEKINTQDDNTNGSFVSVSQSINRLSTKIDEIYSDLNNTKIDLLEVRDDKDIKRLESTVITISSGLASLQNVTEDILGRLTGLITITANQLTLDDITGETVRDKLEALPDKERLDASAIQNLDKYIKTTVIAHGSGIGALRSELDNGYLDDRYVNITGDTMTGPLKIDTDSTTAFFVEQNGVRDNIFIVDTTNGVVGIGAAPTAGRFLDINVDVTDSSIVLRGLSTTLTARSTSSDITQNIFGNLISVTPVAATGRTISAVLPTRSNVTMTSNHQGTITTLNGFETVLTVNANAAGIISTYRGWRFQSTWANPNTLAVANFEIMRLTAVPALNGGSITTLYGIRLDDMNRGGTNFAIQTNAGNIVFNEGGDASTDFRVEGDNDANLLFTDASADTVQVGAATASDSAKFYVSGKISTSGEIEINGDLNHDGTNIGFFGVAPTTRQTELTDELTTITHTAPGTTDYAIAAPVDSSGGAAFGFSTADEFNTVMSVIANLQTRVNELETKLTAYGLLIDAD